MFKLVKDYGTWNHTVSLTHSALLVAQIMAGEINLDPLSFFLSSTDFHTL